MNGGMDWLSKNHATMNCYEKCVVFEHEEGKKSTLQCDRSEVPVNLTSLMKASKLLKKGCQGYLVYVMNKEVALVELNQIPVIREFSDVFLGEFLGFPTEKEVESNIELVPSTNPTSIAPYRMAPSELKELKVQL